MTRTYWSETVGHPCPKCGTALVLSSVHDALACLQCDEWREPGCTDLKCWARCATRPARPSATAAVEPLKATADPTHFFARLIGRSEDPEAAARLVQESQRARKG